MYLIAVFAMVCAMAVVLLVMPKFLPFLKKLKFGQTIYDLGPQAHLAKQGTPNMGGIVTALATVAVTVVFTMILSFKRGWTFGLGNSLWPLLFITVGCMALFGFPDDYIKDVKKDHEGLKPKQKLIGQMVIGLAFSAFCYQSWAAASSSPLRISPGIWGFFTSPS